MTEQDDTASPRNGPYWLMGESDLLRFDRHRSEEGPVHSPRSAGGRARALPASGSGYEQILAARGELRARTDRAVADARRPPAEQATPPTAAARPNLEQPPACALRFDRRDRPALVVWGMLTAPAACVLVAFAWAGPPRSPASSVAALQDSQASLAMTVPAGVAAPSPASGEGTVFSTHDPRTVLRPDDADLVAPTVPMLHGGMPPRSAADATEAEPPQEDALFLAAPGDAEMLPEEVQAAFATWDRRAAPRPSDTEPDASPDTHAEFAESEPALNSRDGDAPIADAALGAVAQEGGEAPPPLAADAGRASGALVAAGAPAEAAPGPAPPAAPVAEGAAELASRDAAGGVPVSTEPTSSETGRQASAQRPDPFGQAPPATASNTGEDAIAGAGASSGGPAADAPAKASPPPPTPRMAALVVPPPPSAARPPAGEAQPTRPRSTESPLSPTPRSAAARDAPPASPQDPRCRAIVVKAQLGEETSHAERLLLRSGCRATR